MRGVTIRKLIANIGCKLGKHNWKIPEDNGYKEWGKRECVNCKRKQTALLGIDVTWITTYKGDL